MIFNFFFSLIIQRIVTQDNERKKHTMSRNNGWDLWNARRAVREATTPAMRMRADLRYAHVLDAEYTAQAKEAAARQTESDAEFAAALAAAEEAAAAEAAAQREAQERADEYAARMLQNVDWEREQRAQHEAAAAQQVELDAELALREQEREEEVYAHEAAERHRRVNEDEAFARALAAELSA